MAPTEQSEASALKLRKPDDFKAELDDIELQFRLATPQLVQARREHAMVVHQAEWHLRGVIHHARKIIAEYSEFAAGVAGRAQLEVQPDILIMHGPQFQTMMYELYALINLARITLDNLRVFLRPVFKTHFGQLPKSINDFLEGETDCPLYPQLAKQEILYYLRDLRNCLVHYRTFATSDNVVVVGDHCDEMETEKTLFSNDWLNPMARARFRRVENGISVNVFLPDKIFDHSLGTEKLVPFTYAQRINLLSQTMNFVRLIQYSLRDVYDMLLEPGVPIFSFSRKKRPK